MHCREKTVSIKLSILWLRKKGLACTYYDKYKSYSATSCTCDIIAHGCTITIPTVQFLIAACKNGGERPGLFKARYIRRVLTIVLEPFFLQSLSWD